MKKLMKRPVFLTLSLLSLMLAGCGKDTGNALKTPEISPTAIPYEGDGNMYVPQLTANWFDAKKITGIDNSEFLSDFLLIQDSANRWHCIGIGGQGHVQDSFFHAIGDNLLEPFTYIDRVYSNGESSLESTNWMWAPYAIYSKDEDKAYMFYHHRTKNDESQMRMLQSADSKLDKWVPAVIPDLDEGCIAFTGDACRDACIFFDEDVGKYIMYYAGTGICMRTSDDLIHWSEPKVVMNVPEGFQAAESPFVIKRFGYYYLFVSGFDYGRIAVYASKDYSDFGHPVNDLLGELNGHAPEIVTVDGKDYIACAAINAWDGKDTYKGGKPAEHNISGVYIQELAWIKKEDAKWLKLPEKNEKSELHIVEAEADYYWSFDGKLDEEKTKTPYEGTLPDGIFSGDAVKGKALRFDGTQKFTMPQFDFKLNQTFTVSFYVYMESTYADYNVLFSKGEKDAGHLELYVTPAGTISFYQNELGIHDTAANICDYAWHHCIFTYDGNTFKGYVDYEEIYRFEIEISILNDEEPVTIGCFLPQGGACYFFNGAIDEFKIFNRVLSHEEMGLKG